MSHEPSAAAPPHQLPCAGLGKLFFAFAKPAKAAAAELCVGCPFRPPCLARAVALRTRHGIWGGVDFADRSAVRDAA